MCVVTIGRNWVRLITKKARRKRRPKGNTKNHSSECLPRREEGGAKGEEEATGQFRLPNSLFFCWSWEGYSNCWFISQLLLLSLSLRRRCDLLTKFIKLWAKMQASHSCFDNVARAAVCRVDHQNKVEAKNRKQFKLKTKFRLSVNCF